jgi:hypothetical protein
MPQYEGKFGGPVAVQVLAFDDLGIGSTNSNGLDPAENFGRTGSWDGYLSNGELVDTCQHAGLH